ncbi:MAG TPA: DNA methyltransferase [Dehalococcoidia bacterium]|nr:DNA methyltransferase [Dehalococcoidia bacterium]
MTAVSAPGRGSSTQQGYGSGWRRLRKQVLREEPNCRRCGAPSTDVDHIVPRRQGGSDDRANLQGLCHSCHSKYTAETDGGFGNSVRSELKIALPNPREALVTNAPPPSPAALTVEMVPIDDLRPDPANPRRISNDQLESLTRSLGTYGFVQPVLARREDKVVIGGHQRLLAARRLGYKEVPVTFLDITLEQARVLNLGLNKISGEWDNELLARLLKDLQPFEDLDLSLTGFGEDELRKLLKSLDLRDKRDRPESFDLDAALEAVRAAPRAQRGETWALGDHRLLCGDSCDAAAVATLLDGKKAQLAFTDPPYNVGLGDHGGQQPGQRRRRIHNDALPPEQWEAFVRGWSRNLLASVDGALYVCMSTKEWPLVSRVLAEQGGHWSDTVIWAKDRFVLGRADYQRQYEPIWYGWREGVSHHWCGDRDQGDVWRVVRPSASDAHPTMKPLPLVERAVENSSRPGDVVLDLFLGSGSTLIAAERTGRTCYAAELDPHYVDVAVLRWEAFSGQKAVRL